MAPREIPDEWRKLLERAGLDSARALAAKAGVGTSTVTRLMHGEGTPDPATVEAVAGELTGGDANRIWKLTSTGLRDGGPWEPPPSSVLLTGRQRRAVEELIRSMTEGVGDGDDSTRAAAPIDRKQLHEDVRKMAREVARREGRRSPDVLRELLAESVKNERSAGKLRTKSDKPTRS